MEWCRREKRFALGLLLFFGVALLASFHFENRLFYQQQRESHSSSVQSEPIGEITARTKVSQFFYADRDNLSGVELQFGTYIRKNSSQVHIAIFQEDRLLVSKTFSAKELKDNTYERISFNKIANSAGGTFRLDIWSEDAVSGNAITLWKSAKQDGALSVDGTLVPGSLNYILCYKEFSWKYPLVIVGIFFLMAFIVFQNAVDKKKIILPWKEALSAAFLLFVGMFFLFLRNAEPFFFPSFYAEDGVFTSMLLTQDFTQVVVSARNDFPVLGLIAMLQGGLWISKLLYGQDLSMLPMINAMISYFFITALALAGYFAFQRYSKFLAIVAYLCVILMPLGTSGNETIARILNLGFLFPTFTVFCLLQRFEETRYTLKVACIDFFNILSCLTLPVSYGLVAIYIACEFVIKREKMTWGKMAQWWSVPMATVLMMLLNYKGLLHSQGGTVGLPFVKARLLEFAVGRTFLYPFVSGYWHKLSDGLVVVLFVVFLAVVLAATIVVWRKKENLWYYVLFSTTAVYWAGLVIPRIGFTSMFDSYHSTYPDRYFYGFNILAVLLCLAGLHIVAEQSIWKRGKKYLAIFMVLSLCNNSSLFEMDSPATTWRQFGTFKESVHASLEQQERDGFNKNGMVPVLIYPTELWKVKIPLDYAEATANSNRGERKQVQ